MAQILDLQEWDECLGKMIRYHSNISMEIRDLILKIRDLIIGGSFPLDCTQNGLGGTGCKVKMNIVGY